MITYETIIIISLFFTTAANVIAIVLNLFLSITILKFRRLRTIKYIHLLHMSFINILYNICFIVNNLLIGNYEEYMSVTIQLLLTLYLIFVFLLGLDWIWSVHNPNLNSFYQQYYIYIHLALYTIFICKWIFIMCYYNTYMLIVYVYPLLLITLLTSFIILNIVVTRKRIVANDTPKYTWNIFRVVFTLYGMLVFWLNVFPEPSTAILLIMFLCVKFITILIWLLHPIFIVYTLGQFNPYFRIAYSHYLGRFSGYSYDELQELNEEELEENTTTELNNDSIKTMNVLFPVDKYY